MTIPTFPFLLPPFERYIPLPHSISIPIHFTFSPKLFPIPLLPSKLFVHYFASVTRPFPYPHIDLFIFMDYSYEPFPLHPHFVPIIPLSFRYLLRVRIKSPEETLPTVSVQPRRLVSEVPRRCPSSTSSKTRSLAYSDPSPRSRPSRPPPSALRPQTFDLSPAISDLRPQTFNFRLATFDLRPQYSFPPSRPTTSFRRYQLRLFRQCSVPKLSFYFPPLLPPYFIRSRQNSSILSAAALASSGRCDKNSNTVALRWALSKGDPVALHLHCVQRDVHSPPSLPLLPMVWSRVFIRSRPYQGEHICGAPVTSYHHFSFSFRRAFCRLLTPPHSLETIPTLRKIPKNFSANLCRFILGRVL
jgi:hypothetical protein